MKLQCQWPCKKELSSHNSCLDAHGDHIQLTVLHLEEWAWRIVRFSNLFRVYADLPLQSASEGLIKFDIYPPDDVLDQWNIGQNNPAPPSHSHCSPYPQLVPPIPSPSMDSAQLSLATVGLLMVITDSISHWGQSPKQVQLGSLS